MNIIKNTQLTSLVIYWSYCYKNDKTILELHISDYVSHPFTLKNRQCTIEQEFVLHVWLNLYDEGTYAMCHQCPDSIYTGCHFHISTAQGQQP